MDIYLRKFQDGGAMDQQQAPEPQDQGGAPEQVGAPADEGGEQPQGGQDPVMQIAQVAMQAIQNKDCEAAMSVCQAFIQLIQQNQGGAPEEQAPQGEPVYRAGGKLVGRIRK